MRVLSLLPSATEIACALGLREDLVGITHECDFPPGIEREKPIVIESCLGSEGKNLPPGEIDARIQSALQMNQGVYRFKPGALQQARPDLILTQGLCDVCAVPRSAVQAAVEGLRPAPHVLSLDPTGLADILADIRRVGEAAGKGAAAEALTRALQARIEAVQERTRSLLPAERPAVACLEWLDPLFTAGHWVPEMVERAGGRDVLAQAGVPSRRIAWEDVQAARPEVLVVMPCGYDLEKARAELPLLARNPGWDELPAVWNGRVYLVEANACFSRPGPRVVDGLEQLAQILHPERFPAVRKAWDRI